MFIFPGSHNYGFRLDNIHINNYNQCRIFYSSAVSLRVWSVANPLFTGCNARTYCYSHIRICKNKVDEAGFRVCIYTFYKSYALVILGLCSRDTNHLIIRHRDTNGKLHGHRCRDLKVDHTCDNNHAYGPVMHPNASRCSLRMASRGFWCGPSVLLYYRCVLELDTHNLSQRVITVERAVLSRAQQLEHLATDNDEKVAIITPSTKLMTLFRWRRIGRGVRESSSSPTWA